MFKIICSSSDGPNLADDGRLGPMKNFFEKKNVKNYLGKKLFGVKQKKYSLKEKFPQFLHTGLDFPLK